MVFMAFLLGASGLCMLLSVSETCLLLLSDIQNTITLLVITEGNSV